MTLPVPRLCLTLLLVSLVYTAAADPLNPNFGAVRSIPSDYFGINQNTVQNPAWRNNALGTKLVGDLNFGSVRYPGGTEGSYFRWWTGDVSSDSPIKLDHKYFIDDLKHVYDQTGATPVFAMNMINGGGIDQQIRQLEVARDKGIPILKVELGNEYYLGDDHWVSRFPDGQSYGGTAKNWASKIREKFPEVEIAVIGAVTIGNTDPDSRRGKWNREVWEVLSPSDVDAVTLHYYTGSGLFGGRVERPNKWGTPEEQASQYSKLLADNGPDVFVQSAFSYLDSVRNNTLPDLPESLDIWVTENSLFDRNGTVRHTWAHGMFTAALQMQMLQDSRTTQTSYHNLFNQAQLFGLAFNDPDDFSGLDPSLPIDQPFNPQTYAPQRGDLTSSGYVMQMFGEALKDADRVQRIWFSNADNWVDVGDDRHPAVMAVRIFDDDTQERRVLILNLSGDVQAFDTSMWVDENSFLETLHADARLHITHPSLVTETFGDVFGTTLLPGYSLTLITDPFGSAIPEPTTAAVVLVVFTLSGIRRPVARAVTM